MNGLIKLNLLALLLFLGVGLYASVPVASMLVGLVHGVTPISLNPVNSFNSILFTGIATGIILYTPIFLISAFIYSKDILYKTEKHLILKYSILAIGLFLIGIIIGLFTFTQYVIPYSVNINNMIGLQSFWDYGSLVTTLVGVALGTGILFLLPIPIRYCIKKGLLNKQHLQKNRLLVGGALFGFIVVFPLTPNDPIGQITLFLPLYLLFEASMWGIK